MIINEMMKRRGVRGIGSGSGGVHHAGCLESRRLIRPCLGVGYSLSSSTDSGEERGRVAGLSASCSSVSLQKHDVQHPRQQASPRNRPWTSRGRSSTEQRASEGGAALIPWPQCPRWASPQGWAAFRNWVPVSPETSRCAFLSTMGLSGALLLALWV